MKPGRLIIVLNSALLPLVLMAQPSWFGYYETNLDGFGVANRSFATGYHKLRLDAEASPSDNVTIGANLIVQKYFGETVYNLADFVPASLFINTFGGAIDFPFPLPDSSYLDNMYARISFRTWDLTLGKQQLSFGPGYVWNPTDIFNFKQLLDPTYEQAGVSAIRLAWQARNWLRIDAVTQPKDTWLNSTKYLQIKANTPFGDITLNAGQYLWTRTWIKPNYRVPLFPMTPFFIINSTDHRTMLGGSFNGEIAGMGLWIEGAHNLFKADSLNFDEISAGADYTFENGLYFMGEAFVNTGGAAKLSELGLDEFFQYFQGQIHSLYRHYLFLQTAYPFSGLLTGSAFAYVNLDDKSWVISPNLSYSLSDNLSLEGMFSRMGGGVDTEFGQQKWQARVRVNAYF